MQARGGKADNFIANADIAAINDHIPVANTHGKSGQIIVTWLVQAGHLSGFSANERTTGQLAALGDAAHHLGGNIQFQGAAGKVIEEKERLGSAHHHIVHAHGHQIDTDGVVAIAEFGYQQLGTHPVGGGNQHWIFYIFTAQ